mmetsp:Transcript_44781/g.95285  ORF Transcript_44781/g.95285 Transcript_44781/m.95285 type:complete len:202 (-) Transcript_44781:337-942(-)
MTRTLRTGLALVIGFAELCSTAALVGAITDPEAARRLWSGAGKPLLRVGSKGAAPSHANGLKSLCADHPYVCIKLTGTSPVDALNHLVELVDKAAAPGRAELSLLATRTLRRGGIEALFSQTARADEVCSFQFHDTIQLEAERAAQKEQADAVTYAAARAAKVERARRKSDKLESRSGKKRQWRPAHSQVRSGDSKMLATR